MTRDDLMQTIPSRNARAKRIAAQHAIQETASMSQNNSRPSTTHPEYSGAILAITSLS
jgi:hypothetical protein